MTNAPDPGFFGVDSTSSGSSGAPEVPWWWQLIGPNGEVIAPPHGRQDFPARADAESWVGECWADLAEEGVDAVTLFEGDRQVYGPMSLSS